MTSPPLASTGYARSVFGEQDADPDYQLVWPADVFAEELAEVLKLYGPHDGKVQRVLEEAFWGDGPLLDLSRPTTWAPAPDPWAEDSSSGARQQLQLLVDRAHEIPKHRSPRPYWGAVSPSERSVVDLGKAARRDWAALITDLLSNGYFSKIAPEECVDGDALDRPEVVLERELSSRLGRPGLFPHDDPDGWPDDAFYGQIEVFHDLVARPRWRSYHDYGNCGWHYSEFSVRCGRRLYRAKVNEILERNLLPLRLATEGEDTGRLVTTSDEPREMLIHRAVSSDVEPDRKSHAVALFRGRGATTEEKRTACIVLAGLLEQRRDLVKAEFLSKDEGALFEIMNRFAIRHRDANQKSDYEEQYLDWIFWWFLASVELVDRLAKRPV